MPVTLNSSISHNFGRPSGALDPLWNPQSTILLLPLLQQKNQQRGRVGNSTRMGVNADCTSTTSGGGMLI
eukprot:5321583-Pyramimonas_sp.AAC.1